MNIDASDDQFKESVIDAVRESPNGYELTHGGWTLWCPKVEGLPAPRVGETLRSYGRGLGHTVRGIVVGGRVYRYMTETQENDTAFPDPGMGIYRVNRQGVIRMKASEAANAVIAYAERCGGVHDFGCPEDDTCDCSAKWINDGVTAAVGHLRADDDLRWVLDNVYTIARREIRRGDVRGMWGHVIRLCEKVGCEPRVVGVLRQAPYEQKRREEPPSVDAVDPVGEKVTE